MTTTAKDRIWAKFRAAEEQSLEQHIDQALGLVRHWPEPKAPLHAVCGAILGTAEDWPCMLPAGHDDAHEALGFTWGEQ